MAGAVLHGRGRQVYIVDEMARALGHCGSSAAAAELALRGHCGPAALSHPDIWRCGLGSVLVLKVF